MAFVGEDMMKFTRFIVPWFVLLVGGLELGSCVTAYSNVSCIESERKALLEFKSGLVDKSNRLSSWSGKDCCSKEGVGCRKNTGHVVKIDLRNNAYFDSIQCYYRKTQNCLAVYKETCLGGQISPSLTNLQHLHYLDLSMNNFAGILIPNFFGSLKNLRYLNLSGAGFSGAIPQHLGNLSALRYLHLGDAPDPSRITGDYRLSTKSLYWITRLLYLDAPDPSRITGDYRLSTKSPYWITRLSYLKSLDLSGAYLGETRDWLQATNVLPSLSSLTLENCNIPSFPHLSHLNFTSLTSLDLQNNDINSTIPFWLLNVTTLVHLNLAYNNLFGSIPNNLEQWSSLTHLDISLNNLNASTPDSLCKLNNIVYMDVSGNQIQGSLPFCLGNLTSLSLLDLAWNNFQGLIPSEIEKLGGLTYLSLYSNRLNGIIPSGLWKLTKLKHLYLSNTFLKGELCEFHFAELTELKFLDISSTKLVLNVSSLWVPPFQLQVIVMDNIQIGFKFPLWLRTQNEVEFISMSNTSISDIIPDWIETLYSKSKSDLISMDFSHNYIRGTAPEFKENSGSKYGILSLNSNKFEGPLKSFPIGASMLLLDNNSLTGSIPQLHANVTLKFLKFLSLSDNHFTGSIPDSLCNIPNLCFLDLSNNQLSGRIPFCFGKFRDLRLLNLAKNNLYGHIPTSLGHIEFLQSLHLNGNNFAGVLPSSLQQLKYLRFLDLSENRLDGIIPSWIGKELSSLRYLILESNNFQGNISMCLCQLSFLQVLNLAQNNLTGYIPNCFNNFSAMISTDLSSPSFSYEIYVRPNFSATLSYDEELSLYTKGRRYNFTSNTGYVRSIDLSENNIIGEIPIEIMCLLGLQNLNLTRNHLSGKIPVNIGHLKEIQSLDFSSNELSGTIPPSLSNLTFLSSLNLSFNKLSGHIPSGNQLQTLDDPSIYMGNSGLCGFPLRNCRDYGNKAPGEFGDHDGNMEYSELDWFYAGLGPGIAVGLVGFFIILLFNKSWRYAYFGFLENLYIEVWVMIGLLKRKFE